MAPLQNYRPEKIHHSYVKVHAGSSLKNSTAAPNPHLKNLDVHL